MDERVDIRPSNNGRKHRVFWMEQRRQFTQKRWRKCTDHFGASSENIGDIKREKDPPDQSGSVQLFSRVDTADNLAKANIQGGEIHPD